MAGGWGGGEDQSLLAKPPRHRRLGAPRPYLAGAAAMRRRIKVAVEIYPDAILRMKQKGCPATIVFPNPTPALAGGNYGINVNAPHPHAAALFVDFVLSADSAKILSGTSRIPTRKGARSVYEELSNLEEKGVPIFVVTAEQTDEVAKPMEKIMKELLTR